MVHPAFPGMLPTLWNCQAPRASYNKSSFPRNLCTIPWNPMISPGAGKCAQAVWTLWAWNVGFFCHIKSSADPCEILQFVLQEIYLKKRMIGWFYIFIIPFLTESAIQGSVFAYLRSYWRCTMLVVPSTKGSFCGDAPWQTGDLGVDLADLGKEA